MQVDLPRNHGSKKRGFHCAGRRVSPGDGGQEANAASAASTGKPTTRTQPPKTWSRRQSHEVIVETKDLGPLVWVPGIKVPGVHKRQRVDHGGSTMNMSM